ncbi:MAG TPA: ABC transporter permease [Gemmatimonadaceae bacterium]|nr:ABC transporter permease [Gemmatimonadaceae bacterium]
MEPDSPQSHSATYAVPPGIASVGGRFISRGRLTLGALYWLAWLIVSPRVIVSAGVQREIEALGVGALRLVASASVLVGLIATFQIASQLTAYGAEAMASRAIGWFAARELGPLGVAILVIARSAAGTAGEFASMSAGGELDALRAMGLDPVKYLVAPKLAALLVALPTLTVVADGLIVFGGWIGNTVFLGYSTHFFLEQFRASFDVFDIFVGVGKSVVFAFIIGVIAADEGLSVERRVDAIGNAATRAVVFCLIGVLAADTVINAIFYFIPGLT